MKAFTALIDVEDRRAKDATMRRLVGLSADRSEIVVARMRAGETEATLEYAFSLDEAVRLAEACLTGDARALTTPGLARILSATAAVLSRVCHAAASLEPIQEDIDADDARRGGAETAHEAGEAGAGDDLGHQFEAGADEDFRP